MWLLTCHHDGWTMKCQTRIIESWEIKWNIGMKQDSNTKINGHESPQAIIHIQLGQN